MVASLTYRRPPYIDSKSFDFSSERNSTNQSTRPTSDPSYGIPDALSFDRIIGDGTCPPCTARDFMNYLKYIEYSAENLQFLLWYKDYCKRFDQLNGAQKALAPEWAAAQTDVKAMAAPFQATNKSKTYEAAAPPKSTTFTPSAKNSSTESTGNPSGSLVGGSPSDLGGAGSSAAWEVSTLKMDPISNKDYARSAAGAFENANLNWQPFTIQPFREEIARIIAAYIAEGAPRELNLSAHERITVLHALRNTTHPSAFRSIVTSVEESLRHQSHPNFIRWSICNGNRARVVFARCLGATGVICGFVAALLLTLSCASRGWRILAAIGWMIGFATLVATWKGMCVVLHGMHRRHLRPWELFIEDDEVSSYELKKISLDTVFTSNSYEEEPWVVKYDKRNIIRKIFDREIWIQEPSLRQVQDTIFIQAVISAFIATTILTGIFVAIPHANMF